MISVMLAAVLCLFLLHQTSKRAIAVGFLGYEVGNDGILRAMFTATNSSPSFVLFKAQAVPDVSTPGWSGSIFNIAPHNTVEFELAVRQTTTSWQLTLNCWLVKRLPDSWNGLDQAVASAPSFTVKGSLINSNSPVKQNDG